MNYILYSGMRGQLKNGVSKTPNIIKPYIKSKNIYNCKIGNNLFEDLNNLYKLNSRVKGRRVNIGGDHSMSIATVSHSLNKIHNLKVLWFDACGDINTTYSSLTNNFNNMSLGFLTGLDNNDKFSYIKNKLKFSNILYIGIRELDDFELNILDICNISYITCSEINNNPQISLLRIKQFLGEQPFHLSFDVGCIDPSIISSTDNIVEKGLKLKQTNIILKELMKKNTLVNMDITELNLDIGNGKLSLINTLKLIN